jgi:hypothetical protein
MALCGHTGFIHVANLKLNVWGESFVMNRGTRDLRPTRLQQVGHGEVGSVVRIATVRVRTWSLRHAERVRTRKGWQ